MAKSVNAAPSTGASTSIQGPDYGDLAIQALPVALIGVIVIAAFLAMRARKVRKSPPRLAVEPYASRTDAKATKYCSDCGAQISARAEICPKCGVRQSSPPSRASGT